MRAARLGAAPRHQRAERRALVGWRQMGCLLGPGHLCRPAGQWVSTGTGTRSTGVMQCYDSRHSCFHDQWQYQLMQPTCLGRVHPAHIVADDDGVHARRMRGRSAAARGSACLLLHTVHHLAWMQGRKTTPEAKY